ncbi:uncharacterized protein [Littorina saxatilis]|uniref:uncharacterized protein n=1 Tax=Littorina saxatilis TaxID=31220 RepID=UPI0038B4280C
MACLHLSRRLFENTVNRRNKFERYTELDNFFRCIAALLNSGGGIAVLHTESTHLFGVFQELVRDRLVRMIPDDSLFTAHFEANVHDDHHVYFRVKANAGRSVCISAFHTKLRVGTSLRDPTQSQFRKLLRELTGQHSQISEGQKRVRKLILGNSGDVVTVGISTDIGACRTFMFQETEEMDARRLPTVEENNPAKVFEYIWRSLPFFISAFSKLSAGGSVFYGIAEQKWTSSEKAVPGNAGRFMYEGALILDKGQLREQITTSAKMALLWYPSFPKDDPVDVVFHPVNTEDPGVQCYVVEVAVRHFPGVVFYNKEGPEVYELRNGEPHRRHYSIDELVEMFQQSA